MIIEQTSHQTITRKLADVLPPGTLLGWRDMRDGLPTTRFFLRTGPSSKNWTALLDAPLHELDERDIEQALPEGEFLVVYLPENVLVPVLVGDTLALREEVHRLLRGTVIQDRDSGVVAQRASDRGDTWWSRGSAVRTAELVSTHVGPWVVLSLPTEEQQHEIEPGSAADRSGLSHTEL